MATLTFPLGRKRGLKNNRTPPVRMERSVLKCKDSFYLKIEYKRCLHLFRGRAVEEYSVSAIVEHHELLPYLVLCQFGKASRRFSIFVVNCCCTSALRQFGTASRRVQQGTLNFSRTFRLQAVLPYRIQGSGKESLPCSLTWAYQVKYKLAFRKE